MTPITLEHLPPMPRSRNLGIGVVGAGFIVRDCHLVAYENVGFQVLAITSRTRSTAEEVAQARKIPKVVDSVEALLDDREIAIIDVAVPPQDQPNIIRRIVAHPRKPQGILAQKPLAMSVQEGRELVELCQRNNVLLQVNQNMRHDHSVRALKQLIDHKILGDPVLATIEMRAIPHWMPWAAGLHSLSTFIMSIHHLDTLRYWLGDPIRVLASTRPDPRTKFAHRDGINLIILEFESGARASTWDDVWTGPAREGSGSEISIQWRFEGTDGLALGTIGWPGWPDHVPSTIDYTTVQDQGNWHRPRWPEAWFPDAFVGPMADLMIAIESGTTPEISGEDNLRTLALCEAVFQASTTHQVVEFTAP